MNEITKEEEGENFAIFKNIKERKMDDVNNDCDSNKG